MKQLMILSIFLWIAACNQASSESAGPSAEEQLAEANTNLVYGYLDAISSNNLDAVANALSDDFIGYGPNYGDSVTKAQVLQSWTGNWDSVFTSINYARIETTTESIAEGENMGDWVMDWANISLNYQDGSSATFMFHGVFKVADSKIVTSASFYNVADILTQRGFTFVPPSGDGDN
ncbi:MAG: hypothetical protein O2887_10095 [Bacteroidetes bacterium]|nr:hypothetical protein [Bacteroidota bacterium]MDA1120820.1 hypothetical protein [Bacteroidota bacterium]